MASPFAIFRKFRKPMMVAITLMAILAFVFLDSISGNRSGPEEMDNPVVATSTFGEIRAGELQYMRDQRNMLLRYLRTVMQFRQQAMFTQSNRQNLMFEFSKYQADEQRLFGGMFPPATERSVVESRILAEEAQRAGLIVNDDAITDFLNEVTGNLVTKQQFDQVMASLRTRRGQSVPQSMLYSALRSELLAIRYREAFLSSLENRGFGPVVSPAQRWDYYLRLKRRATVEIAPVAAADVIDTIDDPKETVLSAFFDQYKNTEPLPGSPEPGFKIPHKAKFEFFRAEYEKYFDPKAVPEADVLAYYEKNKDPQYTYSDLDGRTLTEPEDKPKETPAEKPPATPDETKKEDKPAAKVPAPKKDADKPDAPKDDGAKKEETPKKDDVKKDDAKKDDAKKEDGKKEDSKKEDKPDEGASSQCGDEDPPKKDEAPKAAEPDKATPPAKTDEPPATTTTPATPAADASAAVEAKPSPESPPPLPTPYILPHDVREGSKPKFDPLWKVEESIRKTLASEKAAASIDKMLNALRESMQAYSLKLAEWESRVERDPGLAKPESPDFAALARAQGLTAHATPLLSRFEAAKLPDLGQSTVDRLPFAAYAFRSLKVYYAAESQETEGNRYLFWKIEDQPTRVPALAEKPVREEVVRAWKMVQAREKIMAQAKDLAAKANTAKAPLKDALAKDTGIKVSEAGPFSWLTTGTAGVHSRGQEPRLSEVEGVVDPDDSFMRTVFGLEVGQTGVAINRPKTIAYVVRVTSLEPSRELLRDTFLVDPFNTYAGAVGNDLRDVYQAWIKDRLAAAQLKWEITPTDGDEAEFESE